MRTVRIGMASLDTTVGAMRSNTDKIIAFARQLSAQQCTICSFSEQVISGYPVEDLVTWPGFVEAQWRELLRFVEAARAFGGETVFTLGLTVRDGAHLYNSMAVVQAGRILGIVPKEKLPAYEVFYEQRTFTAGREGFSSEVNGVPLGDLIFRFPFGTLAVEVCEDLWTDDGPTARRAFNGAELIINGSASPWRSGIVEARRQLVTRRSEENRATVVYVNQVGGQDSLVFDGGGFVAQGGALLMEAARWKETTTMCEVDLDVVAQSREQNRNWQEQRAKWLREHGPASVIESPKGSVLAAPAKPAPKAAPPLPREAYFDDLLHAMKTGLAGYFEKTGAFQRIGVALSGGKDSALTLIIAWLYARETFASLDESARAAAMSDFIHAFSMPTRFNSATTRSIARDLCAELGVTFHEIAIDDAFARETEAAQAMLGKGAQLSRITRQNIQARIRGSRMWNWANSANALWLQTGNMSEKAVGYTTVGGDLMGGYSLIGNLPKTVVTALLQHLLTVHRFPSLEKLLATRASAELEENQEDERDLMPFEVLDACFSLFAGEKLMPVELYRRLRAKWSDEDLLRMSADFKPGLLKEWVKKFARLFVTSIYKWVQAPQAVHLGALDLDRERALQLPVVQSQEWLDLDALDREP
jgi:NAD+ synthase (glutamine-hydrolysing)